MNIKELIQSAQSGDSGALETLLRHTEKDIYSLLYFLTKSDEDISDIVQEVLLKIAGKLHSLKNPGMFKPWVNKITLRKYYDYLRKNKKKEKEEFCEIPEMASYPAEDILGDELIRVIKDSVCKLPENYKIPILMREFEGLTYQEIAKITNTNVGTVKSRIARARSRLKEFIKPYME